MLLFKNNIIKVFEQWTMNDTRLNIITTLCLLEKMKKTKIQFCVWTNEPIFQMSDDSGTSFSRVKKDVMVY